jgi:hypothetical protein
VLGRQRLRITGLRGLVLVRSAGRHEAEQQGERAGRGHLAVLAGAVNLWRVYANF